MSRRCTISVRLFLSCACRGTERPRLRFAAACSLAFLLSLCPANALDPQTRITQYFHTAWRIQDGTFDGAPNAVAQTTDGYIWIGTASGLVKYDGARFDAWSPPSGKSLPDPNVISLRASSDGALWIGTARGLLSWKNNELREHLSNRINGIIEDHKGRIWVARARTREPGGLCQITGEHPGCIGGDDHMKLPNSVTLAEDLQGNIWVGGTIQLLRWRDGSFESYFREQLAPRDRPNGVESVAAAADGSVWVSVPSEKSLGLLQIVDGRPKRVVLDGVKQQEFTAVFADRTGSLWLATSDDGLYRSYGGRVDHFRSEDGLSSNTVTGFFEDREGNLWVATSKGLDFFRENRVVTFSRSEGLSADNADSVLATDDGTVWIGNRRSLDVIRHHRVTSVPIPGQRVTALWQDHAKRLWVGIDNQLTIYEQGQFHRVNRPDGRPLGITTAIGEDREQNIWAVANPDRTLYRIRDRRVQEEFRQPQIPAAPRLVADDHSGGIWLAFADRLGQYRNGKLDPIWQANAVTLAVEADGGLWASTRVGLFRVKDGRAQTLTSKNGLKCDMVYSAIRDDHKTLWLYTKCGLIGITAPELDRWWRDPGAVIQTTVLDTLDGVRPSSATFQPAASKSPDGRLWFSNDAVVQMFDPNHPSPNRPAPPVYIHGVRADRKDYGVHGSVSLPPQPRDIEIRYTALSYSIPQRVRFRYKLEPRDGTWQDAGSRRQAFYSDLPAGRYRFRVTGSNSDGVWNESGASLEFSIEPRFYQTGWFVGACAAGFLTIVWGAYKLRLHQLDREFNARIAERVHERTRIARELHDTLLQSVQGVMFSFQAARNLLPERTEEAIRTLDSAIREGDEAIAEGRDAIQGLRADPALASDLEYLLTAAGKELAKSSSAQGESPAFRVIVEGAQQRLSPALQDEVHRIAREILRNAFYHSHASRIEAEITYDSQFFRMRIRDDGKGIQPEILKQGARPGHWGLPGVRERAKRIGATLKVWSEGDAGTEVELTIPPRIAYGTEHRRDRLTLFRKKKVGS